MAGAFFHAQEFIARQRLIGIERLGALADEDRPTIDARHLRRGKRLAQVAFGLRFAVCIEVLEIDRALLPPDGFSGLFVEGDHELVIAPVEIHDQQIAVENRRRAGTAIMIAHEIAPFPKHFARFRVQTSRSWRAERHINAARFYDRRRRGVTVELMTELRLLDLEDPLVPQNPAGAAIHAKNEQAAPVFGRRREPDLVAQNDGRRPCLAVDRRLPLHVFRFTPGQRQIAGVGPAVAVRPAELRPVLARPRRDRQQGCVHEKKHSRHSRSGIGQAGCRLILPSARFRESRRRSYAPFPFRRGRGQGQIH